MPDDGASTICGNCGHDFAWDEAQRALVNKLRDRGAPLAMLKCPKCRLSIGIDLQPRRAKPVPLWKCPVSRCDGWVCHVVLDGLPQWACGECGSFWKEKENLLKEVTEICIRFPYRAAFYEVRDDHLHPSEMTSVAAVSEKIANEPDDDGLSYERG
jgi:hypothetical protein